MALVKASYSAQQVIISCNSDYVEAICLALTDHDKTVVQ